MEKTHYNQPQGRRRWREERYGGGDTVAIAAAAANVTVTVTAANIIAAVVAAATGVNLASSVAATIALTQAAEAPVDGRCQRDKRRHNNQPDKRHERGRW